MTMFVGLLIYRYYLAMKPRQSEFTFEDRRNILPQDGEAIYYPDFFSANESEKYFQHLLQETKWAQEPIQIFGKKIMQPRLTAWYGDEGKNCVYSGISMNPLPWTETLLKIKSKIEAESGVAYTSVLLNLYRDNKDSMGWHRDNEKELGPEPVIGSVSFGETRTFQFQHLKDKTLKASVDLKSGSFLLMKGKTQNFWNHGIPKRAGFIGPRINLTFRRVY